MQCKDWLEVVGWLVVTYNLTEQAHDLCHQQCMRKDETVEDFGARV